MNHRADFVLFKIGLQFVALFCKNRENMKDVCIKVRHGRQNYFRIFDAVDVHFCNLLPPCVIFIEVF